MLRSLLAFITCASAPTPPASPVSLCARSSAHRLCNLAGVATSAPFGIKSEGLVRSSAAAGAASGKKQPEDQRAHVADEAKKALDVEGHTPPVSAAVALQDAPPQRVKRQLLQQWVANVDELQTALADTTVNRIVLAANTYEFDSNIAVLTGCEPSTWLCIDRDDVTIEAETPGTVVIDAKGERRVFEIRGTGVQLIGLKITGGDLSWTGLNGGGLYIASGSSATLKHCKMSGNVAPEGGGLFIASGGSAALNGCQIYQNAASWGGGVAVGSPHGNGGLANLNYCNIWNNTATTGGGGLFVRTGGLATLNSCQIDQNEALWGGGLFIETGGSATLSSCQIYQNEAIYGAGTALSMLVAGSEGGQATLICCTVVGSIDGDGSYHSALTQTSVSTSLCPSGQFRDGCSGEEDSSFGTCSPCTTALSGQQYTSHGGYQDACPVAWNIAPPPSPPPFFPPPPLSPPAAPVMLPAGASAWFRPGRFDLDSGTWPDATGTHPAAALSGSGLTELRSAGHGAVAEVVALSGTTASVVSFGDVVPSSFTICSATRYTGGTQSRILQGAGWAHGHLAGEAGVAYYGFYKAHDASHQVSPTTDWVIMCGSNVGTWSPTTQSWSTPVLVNGGEVPGALTAAGGVGALSLWINGGIYSSDFAVAEVIVWPRGLTREETYAASTHLMGSVLGVTPPAAPPPPSSPSPSPPPFPPQPYLNYARDKLDSILGSPENASSALGVNVTETPTSSMVTSSNGVIQLQYTFLVEGEVNETALQLAVAGLAGVKASQVTIAAVSTSRRRRLEGWGESCTVTATISPPSPPPPPNPPPATPPPPTPPPPTPPPPAPPPSMPPDQTGGDPITKFQGVETRYYLSMHHFTPVLEQGPFVVSQLAGPVNPPPGLEAHKGAWVLAMEVDVSGLDKIRIETVDPTTLLAQHPNATAPPATANALTTMRLSVGGKQLTAGEHKLLIVDATLAVSAKRVRSKRRIGSGWMEQITVQTDGLELRITSAKANKFANEEHQVLGLHLDLEFLSFDEGAVRGALPELWGLQPMSEKTKLLLDKKNVDN